MLLLKITLQTLLFSVSYFFVLWWCRLSLVLQTGKTEEQKFWMAKSRSWSRLRTRLKGIQLWFSGLYFSILIKTV